MLPRFHPTRILATADVAVSKSVAEVVRTGVSSSIVRMAFVFIVSMVLKFGYDCFLLSITSAMRAKVRDAMVTMVSGRMITGDLDICI